MTDSDILTETYDNGETVRFIGQHLGEWIETDTAVRKEDLQ